jgi:hypothetical protein
VNPPAQTELFQLEITGKDCRFMVDILRGKDWATAAEILQIIGHDPKNENAKRSLRAVADASAGQICGGQRGYKLATEMTLLEYDHWRNGMLSQARELQRRVIETDKLVYPRRAVPV